MVRCKKHLKTTPSSNESTNPGGGCGEARQRKEEIETAMKILLFALTASAVCTVGSAFANTSSPRIRPTRLNAASGDGETATDRRSFAASVAASVLFAPLVSSAGETRQGVELTPFNSLAFNYRGTR